jgi:hypothetical protein
MASLSVLPVGLAFFVNRTVSHTAALANPRRRVD